MGEQAMRVNYGGVPVRWEPYQAQVEVENA
jgi:hypothetical protein